MQTEGSWKELQTAHSGVPSIRAPGAQQPPLDAIHPLDETSLSYLYIGCPNFPAAAPLLATYKQSANQPTS